jgi:hypothetical protein
MHWFYQAFLCLLADCIGFAHSCQGVAGLSQLPMNGLAPGHKKMGSLSFTKSVIGCTINVEQVA